MSAHRYTYESRLYDEVDMQPNQRLYVAEIWSVLPICCLHAAVSPWRCEVSLRLMHSYLNRGLPVLCLGRPDGWFFGQNIETQKIGIFPGNFCMPVLLLGTEPPRADNHAARAYIS